jgi:hypothetical protein
VPSALITENLSYNFKTLVVENMTETIKRPLRVFLCHASADKPAVRALYKRFTSEGIDAWLDEEKLMPGAYWRDKIPKAIQETDVVIVCLSKNSVTKEGEVDKTL